MPNFKYTVANKSGKKLSGTVEAPDEKVAREELNNLGFSILSLLETKQSTKIASHLTKFVFEGYDKNSKFVSGTVPAKTKEDALKRLKEQYELNINAIWQEGATKETIQEEKKANLIQKEVLSNPKPSEEKVTNEETKKEAHKINEEELKHSQFKEKIDYILNQVKKLLVNLEPLLDPDHKAEINKKMDKLLRIKHSKNYDYILVTAKELLNFLHEQEKTLKDKGLQNERLHLKMKTKKLLGELKKESNQTSFSESIINKIDGWHSQNKSNTSATAKFISRTLHKVKKIFTVEPEIKAIKEQIKNYNHQIWDLTLLYFKEPTPEYKKKVKTAIKTVRKAKKKAKQNLKEVKKHIKAKNKLINKKDESLASDITSELNAFTGWLLSLYIIYYFVSLYITSKDFGLDSIPKSLYIYESHIFKYALIILFLLHTSTALKINFFKKNFAANIILPIFFGLSTVVALLNF